MDMYCQLLWLTNGWVQSYYDEYDLFEKERIIMNMYYIILVVWLSILTMLVIRMIQHYNALTTGVSKKGLKEILEMMLGKVRSLETVSQELRRDFDESLRDGQLHIQRIGIVRFNPFADTGGSQSFTIALLDGRDDGLILTSLYARTGNRWYLKEVRGGKGKNIELSHEETNAIRQAKKIEEKHA